jgi:subtilisin family serine protease
MLGSIFALIAVTVAAPATQYIPNQYIVVFKDHVKDTQKALENYMSQLQSAAGFAELPESTVVHKFDLPTFKGATLKMPESFTGTNEMLPNEDIAFIEQDQIATTLGTQTGAPWGLNRISSRDRPGPGAVYTYPDSAGEGVYAYVIDTGVLPTHPDFQGRAVFGADFTREGAGDGNGHGTHCAGTVGATTYGVAKKVNVVGVRVLGSSGSGSFSGVIAGIEWATREAVQKNRAAGKIVSVANMSLGGGASQAVDDAVKAATDAGLVMAVAAGNSRGDACRLSPARAPSALTVAASDINDSLATFSERGPCVDIIAPGVNVLSTWNNGGTRSISGTSMAAPHVAGIVALALADNNFQTVAEVNDYIKRFGTPGKITGNLQGAPNSLAYNKFE